MFYKYVCVFKCDMLQRMSASGASRQPDALSTTRCGKEYRCRSHVLWAMEKQAVRLLTKGQETNMKSRKKIAITGLLRGLVLIVCGSTRPCADESDISAEKQVREMAGGAVGPI